VHPIQEINRAFGHAVSGPVQDFDLLDEERIAICSEL
jgi:hypothetical protein